ncbi:MAG TPA: c-type cytochrome [Tenuifilaceae bacterium]|nr:c-type cytochrome [Tenuifilaceae bacterium]
MSQYRVKRNNYSLKKGLRLKGLWWIVIFLIVIILAALVIDPVQLVKRKAPLAITDKTEPVENPWQAPAETTIPADSSGEEIRYGKNLIANTANYLGPQGTVKAISNGMNCQNCHLEAGTKPFGNNYSAVASTYPKFRARSGSEETIEKRINDCLERSLNGQPLANDSREMRAIISYMKWLGQDVPKGVRPPGVGLVQLDYLDYPADPAKGKIAYEAQCVQCHGKNGEGTKSTDAASWTYPPLWGKDSYNDGAGLLRLSLFAGYIKANMPLGATYEKPQLSDEEAWNIAAYVNSLPRPKKDIANDWPDISRKPIDHPFGPYTDGFDEKQHKYGPFAPIVEARKTKKG